MLSSDLLVVWNLCLIARHRLSLSLRSFWFWSKIFSKDIPAMTINCMYISMNILLVNVQYITPRDKVRTPKPPVTCVGGDVVPDWAEECRRIRWEWGRSGPVRRGGRGRRKFCRKSGIAPCQDGRQGCNHPVLSWWGRWRRSRGRPGRSSQARWCRRGGWEGEWREVTRWSPWEPGGSVSPGGKKKNKF